MTALPARETNDAAPGEAVRPASAQRRCLVTGEVRDKSALLRFVLGPGGSVVPDVAGRLPGRGLWLTPRRDIVKNAVSKGLFAKAAKAQAGAAADLDIRVEALLARRAVDLLGLARRAGQAVAGFAKVEAALRAGKAAVLVEAADGSADGRGKLASLGPGVPVVGVLMAAELGQAFGREHVVHAALSRGRLAQGFLAETARLAGFRAIAGTEKE
jgi:uncharacterized protein